jgi:hypothetical protein
MNIAENIDIEGKDNCHYSLEDFQHRTLGAAGALI